MTARRNYITPDRYDVAFAVEELARRMSRPTKGDWLKFRRLGRYFLGRPRMQQVYPWQNSQTILKVYTDADWAGCRETRKSMFGGCVMLGRHALKSWSKTRIGCPQLRRTRALRSLKGIRRALGNNFIAEGFGIHSKRRGLG